MALRTFKRVVVISDLHCGHIVGLTPPGWLVGNGDEVTNDKTKSKKFEIVRRQCWDFYSKTLKALQPIDILIVNGDCIDGRGVRSGGTEELEINRDRQCNMAIECIREANAKEIRMIYGTPYHVGDTEDWENIIADRLGVKIGSHEWFNVNGLIIDCKHHLGSSSVPQGRYAALAREILWNDEWSIQHEQPLADILIRSHTHYSNYIGSRGRLAIITPALQGMGSKFGARICSGTVDFGLIHFDINDKGEYSWAYHIAKLSSQAAKPVIL